MLLLWLLLPGVLLFALSCGAVPIPLRLLWSPDGSTESAILHGIRLPRVLLGAFAGAALAGAGTILQSVLRNDLASPGILGVSAGGGAAGLAVLLLLPDAPAWLPAASFAGALAAALLIYLAAWRNGVSPERLILAGVALSALLSALSGTMLILNSEKVAGVLDFSLGSLSGRGWREVRICVPYLLAALAATPFFARRLDLLVLGDESAASLGLRVEATRTALLALAALLAAGAVSAAGLLGFVGLIAPHTARLLTGALHRRLIPASLALGAMLVVLADAFGRSLRPPEELPAGVALALLGPLFFLWLLRRRGGGS